MFLHDSHIDQHGSQEDRVAIWAAREGNQWGRKEKRFGDFWRVHGH